MLVEQAERTTETIVEMNNGCLVPRNTLHLEAIESCREMCFLAREQVENDGH